MSETVVNFSHEDVTWSDQGAICINANLLQRLFQPLTQKIIKVNDTKIQLKIVISSWVLYIVD